MWKDKKRITSVIIVFIVCFIYNISYFVVNGVWNQDAINISCIMVISAVVICIIIGTVGRDKK